jgi:putative FmdB family regulatory protein
MLIYEFRGEECGTEFEELVKAGSTAASPSCGSGRVKRVFSVQAAPFGLVKTPWAARRQGRRNAKLRKETKTRFKQARQRARDRHGTEGGS